MNRKPYFTLRLTCVVEIDRLDQADLRLTPTGHLRPSCRPCRASLVEASVVPSARLLTL